MSDETRKSIGNRDTAPDSNAGKVSLSLVMKLNLHTIAYTFGVLMTLNILLCLTFLSLTFWTAEENAATLLEEFSLENKTVMEYTFEPSSEEPNGNVFWGVFHEMTPLQEHQVIRRMWFRSDENHSISALEYKMVFTTEKVSVTYHVGSVLVKYQNLLIALLLLEVLILFLGLGKGRRRIRQILRPLSDITRQAQDLTSASVGNLPAEEIKRLQELAGTISNIDATKLDRRLSVDGAQNELKDLATAINSMLNRIDEAYRSQVRFVSDASHELRTPISVIQGYVNLLDRWGKNDEATLQEAIDAIKSESESMKDLIEQLLFLARGDNETLHLNLETFDCTELMEEIFKETQLIDTYHTFKIKSEAITMIHADRQLFKQALRILIDNSIKYTPEPGEISASISESGNMVRISVQDNGIGIDADNLPYIFDRFYRSDESRARKTGGSGLGLAIMKWIIDRHGGSIEVISRKDIGTRTTIQLRRG